MRNTRTRAQLGLTLLEDRSTPAILWVSVVSDLVIAISFISLPGILMYFARKREGLPLRWIFVVFGVFIVALASGLFAVNAMMKLVPRGRMHWFAPYVLLLALLVGLTA